MKKNILTIFLGLSAFFFCVNFAFAQVVITEVQIAPIDARFIELHNTSDADVDLTGWYIQRKTATGSSFNSLVTKTYFENKTIAAGGYFLISRGSISDADIVKGNLTLTESNTLRIRNSDGEDVDQVEWGSVEEGKSYQKTLSGSWIVAAPTPHSSTNSQNSGLQQSTEDTTQQETSTSEMTGSVSDWPTEPQIFARIKEAPNVAMVGADVLFKGWALGTKKEPLGNARYSWTFGDGGTAEGESVLYSYNHPGTYVVILNVSSGKFSAADRVIVEAIPADLVISSVGTGDTSFVEVNNKTKYELDLSWWKLHAGGQSFVIPENTIILPGGKIMFPSQNTGFEITKWENVDLLYPNGVVAYSYSWKPAVQAPQTNKPISQNAPVDSPVKDRPLQTVGNEDKVEVVEMGGEQQSANVFTAANKNGKGIYKWLLGVTALVAISIIGILFTGREEKLVSGISKEADEYEIVEEKD